jgi:hypothetical protein
MSSSIFRQLTAGIKFDKGGKFRQDAEKFGLVQKKEVIENVDKNVEIISLDDDFVPDSNLPTPEDSSESNEDSEAEGGLTLLGNITVQNGLYSLVFYYPNLFQYFLSFLKIN